MINIVIHNEIWRSYPREIKETELSKEAYYFRERKGEQIFPKNKRESFRNTLLSEETMVIGFGASGWGYLDRISGFCPPMLSGHAI